MSRFVDTLTVSHLDIDAELGLAWVIDTAGHVWFTTGVSVDCPPGSGLWWQVERTELPVM